LPQPNVEQRLGTFIVLHGEAVDGSRAIIDVEVHGEVLARLTVGVAEEMLRDPGFGPEQSLLFAGACAAHAGRGVTSDVEVQEPAPASAW
jgi:hypothetical protein